MSHRRQRAQWEEEGFEPGVIPDRRWPWYLRRAADATAIGLFFLILMLAAIPMGANRDWAWAPLCIAFGLMAIPVAFGVGSRGGLAIAAAEERPLLALIVCFAAFLTFALWQMSTLAPLAGDAWLFARAKEILGEAHAPIPAVAADFARNSILRSIACALIFLMARAICRDRDNARWLLVAMVLSGVLVVAYGLAMQVSTNACYVGTYLKIQFEYAETQRCLMSGTFVNSNSFACYVGMAIVAVIALLFSRDKKQVDAPYGYNEEDDTRFINWLTGKRIAQLAALLLLLGGLLFSASRAGFAATVVGVLAFGILMMRGRWKSRPDLGRIFFIGLAVCIVVGLIAGGALINKFADSDDPWARLRIWQTSFKAIALSPWLGWGLGGFADAYMILQPASILQPNDLAHSTPIEIMVELGVFGAMLAFAVVLLPWIVCLRGALRRRLAHRHLPIAAFALAAIPILHSTVDFSLQMPAIGFVVSAFLGMGWAQAFGRRERVPERFVTGH
jgi:O-antigen ligase